MCFFFKSSCHLNSLQLFLFQEKFLVKWLGFEEATWEPIENLDNVIDMVIAFNQQEANKKKGKSHSSDFTTADKTD